METNLNLAKNIFESAFELPNPPKDPVFIEIERRIKDKQISEQIGCGYCKLEETCKERDPKINKAKLDCKLYKHWSVK